MARTLKTVSKRTHGNDPVNAGDLSLILEDEIATGRLPPGTRLEEIALGERFGVSRTPVREALRLLAASGLVELRPRKGAVVSAPSLDQLIQMFEVMAEMEAMCGRLAARRMTLGEQDMLVRQHRICNDAAKAGDADLYYEENAKFHEVIYAGTHNAFLAQQVRNLRRRLQVYRRLQLRLPGRIEDSFEEHSRIVEAILAHDPQAAEEALLAHVAVQGDRFGDWISSLSASQFLATGT